MTPRRAAHQMPGQGFLLAPGELPKQTRSRRTPSGDQDPADAIRRFHGWTQDKLTILRLYLKMYRQVAGSGTYIDGFAGTGQANVDGEIVEGSPVLALRSGAFKRLHFFELEDNAKDLDHYLRSKFTVKRRARTKLHVGDVNEGLPALLASGVVPENEPCWVFLDPNSTELDWATIEAVAAFKTFDPSCHPMQCKAELWILFNLGQALQRMWSKNRTKYPDTFSPETLDRVMGSRTAWRDLWDAGLPSSSLETRYCQRLLDLGYQWVVPHRIRDRTTNRVQYTMIHASDHPAAIDFMKWASRATEAEISDQLLMFKPD
jgi:three-Cys-motif partner protein